jgi:5-methyltetrahydropteroyltriglutamate--homocysteine methyltransferase
LIILKEAGVEQVQIDEPILVKDLDESFAEKFKTTFDKLSSVGIPIVLTTYYGRLSTNINFITPLPIEILHIDLDKSRFPQNAENEFDSILTALKPTKIGISLGVVSGRNIWKNEFASSIQYGKKAIEVLGKDRKIQISTSSSLLHIPYDLDFEPKLKPDIKDWFAFSIQKCQEVSVISKALIDETDPTLDTPLKMNQVSIKDRKDFVEKESSKSGGVSERVKNIKEEDLKRKSPYEVRLKAQNKRYPLPPFPTTTIGSFPVSYLHHLPQLIQFTTNLRFSKPKKFETHEPNSERIRSQFKNTTSLFKTRLNPSSNFKNPSHSTFWFTVNLRGMIWFNISAKT